MSLICMSEDDYSKTASNFTLRIMSCLCSLDCGTCSDADLLNRLVPNIEFLTDHQDISNLIKCFGFKLEDWRIGSMLRAT